MEGRLVEGKDYTLENGLMVFTADYLRRRGFCCRNGCRNCPWDHAGLRPERVPFPFLRKDGPRR